MVKFGLGTLLILVCESLRVCIKGTLRVGEINGSSIFDSRLDETTVVAWLMSDFLCLCRDVRLSSRGFMSGGSRAILRNIAAR